MTTKKKKYCTLPFWWFSKKFALKKFNYGSLAKQNRIMDVSKNFELLCWANIELLYYFLDLVRDVCFRFWQIWFLRWLFLSFDEIYFLSKDILRGRENIDHSHSEYFEEINEGCDNSMFELKRIPQCPVINWSDQFSSLAYVYTRARST